MMKRFLCVIFLAVAAPLFAQYLQYPDSIDAGNYIDGTNYGSKNVSISIKNISEDSVFAIKSFGTDIHSLYYEGNLADWIAPGATLTIGMSYFPLFTDSGELYDHFHIDYAVPKAGIAHDTAGVLVKLFAIPPRGPFISTEHFDTVLSICPCDSENTQPYYGMDFWITNPLPDTIQVDTAYLTSDTGTLGFHISDFPVPVTFPFIIYPGKLKQIQPIFQSEVPGLRTAHFHVLVSFPNDSTKPKIALDSTISAYAVYNSWVWKANGMDVLTPYISVDSCSGAPTDSMISSPGTIQNCGKMGYCNDSTVFHLQIVTKRANMFTLYHGPLTFWIDSTIRVHFVSKPVASATPGSDEFTAPSGDTVHIWYDYCPTAPGNVPTADNPKGYVYDTLQIVGTAGGESDTTYLPIATHTKQLSGIAETVPIPVGFSLYNYPNPFTVSTHIHMESPLTADARVSVMDMFGRQVAVLMHMAGAQELEWSPGLSLPSGTYFVVVKTSLNESVKPMLYMR